MSLDTNLVSARLTWPALLARSRDRAVLAASLLHGGTIVALLAALGARPAPLMALAAVPLLALLMCWGSNTVSHIHLHTPLFRAPAGNRLFSLYLSALLGVPQTYWKRRHLAHHDLGEEARRLGGRGLGDALELGAVVAPAAALVAVAPRLLLVLVPGWLCGLGLCALQGHYEHQHGAFAIDHHGRLYNRFWFNDGFHTAHHRTPNAHWSALGADGDESLSPWPPILRWFQAVRAAGNGAQGAFVDALERLALFLPGLRGLLLATHRPAWRAVLAEVPAHEIRRVVIVGGGLFPRTALLLGELLPDAELVLLDACPAHLETAVRALRQHQRPPARVQPLVARHGADAIPACDLMVIPLAYRGDRDALYGRPPARFVAIHDWIWRRRTPRGRRVSWLLLKRLNLVVGAGAE